MDLLKTLLVYMMVVMSSATESNPSVTPIPPTVTPAPTAYVTQAPTPTPTADATMAATMAPTATTAPTQTPTATPTTYTTLSKGSKGDDVRKLQRRLQELGYYNGTVDGDYGNQTKKAVERFQLYNDLKVDGVAGRATQSMLYESTAVVTAPPEITQGPTNTPNVTAEPVTVNIPVYYVDQNGKILTETVMTIYGTATIYAQNSMVPDGYQAISPSNVKVTVTNGMASPTSVVFRYQAPATQAPTEEPTAVPTEQPTEEPTAEPTEQPTVEPTAEPTEQPTVEPTAEPTEQPTEEPTAEPTEQPTVEPTAEPTEQPTEEPTAEPTEQPTEEPTAEPTEQPTEEPTAEPTEQPTEGPTAEPTEEPDPLKQAGTTLGINGSDQNVIWYRDAENVAYFELKALADAAQVPCDAPEGMLSMTLNGHNIAAQFTLDTLTNFKVDGQALTENELLPLIWDGKLYVSDALLIHFGVTVTDGGDIMAIESFAP